MSETTSLMTIQGPDSFNLHSVGFQLPDTILKIDNPDPETGVGEILVKGRNVMIGYLNNEVETRKAIDENGWLHSGDLGRKDEHGFVYVTGRIKELIITAGGENIAPLVIEDAFKDLCPPCSNIMVIGDKQRFLCALITLKVNVDINTGVPSMVLTTDT